MPVGRKSARPKRAKTKTVSIELPLEIALRLERAAQRRGTTKSAVVREALERHVSAARGESALERIRDLVGSVEGARDLSYNPKYMRDFGK